MTSLFSLTSPVQSICWPTKSKLVKNVLLVLTGALVLAIASQLTIPLKPVPLTFQSATVLFIALIYGARLGAATIATYLAAGACGLPVFAEMYSGLDVLFFSPTSGYLWGFFFAALGVGYLAERGWGKHFISSFAAALLGAAILFSMGLLVLAHYTGWDMAYAFGLKPFLLSESIKLLAVAIVVPRFWKSHQKAH